MMPAKEIMEYYDSSAHRETRDDLRLAVSLIDDFKIDDSMIDSRKIAVDCGCGAGSDIAYLRVQGFQVYAFDSDPEAIARCRKRFAHDEDVRLSQTTFSQFDYPKSTLIVADASLYFCPKNAFPKAWQKITDSLLPGGVFTGSFLGPDDSMACPDFNESALWSEVMISTVTEVREYLNGFDVIAFNEHRTTGESVGGVMHDWHIISVVARKQD